MARHQNDLLEERAFRTAGVGMVLRGRRFLANCVITLTIAACCSGFAISGAGSTDFQSAQLVQEEVPLENGATGQETNGDEETDEGTAEDEMAPASGGATNGSETNTADPATQSAQSETEEAPIPEIITNLEDIPFPTRKMRELILEAAREGDVEKLRPYLGFGDDVTMLALDGVAADPIDFLKSQLGDSEGHEILAIMTEILEVPPVRLRESEGDEIYVWPYFYTYPFDKMTPRQRVEMFRIITYGDYEDMLQFGTYNFFRLGISPEGRWLFFVAGD